jgi:hypothetical protein
MITNLENGNPINMPDINNFPAIYERYRQLKNRQHELMASEYINLMTGLLQQVHQLLNDQLFINSLGHYSFSLNEFYTSLSYLGLQGTKGFKSYMSDPENSQNFSISYYDAQSNSTKTPNCD